MSNFEVNWIISVVKSIRSPHVKRMILHMPRDLTTREQVDSQLPGVVHTQWLALDKALVEYLTTRLLKLEVKAPCWVDKDVFDACVESLLPNLFGKKMLEVQTS